MADAQSKHDPLRRSFLLQAAALGGVAFMPGALATAPGTLITRALPGAGQELPVIGMGSWLTFSIGRNERARKERLSVLNAFFEAGGRLIDSSPMYGSSEATIGWCLSNIDNAPVFAATKVWDVGKQQGIEQMRRSLTQWRRERVELMQVHNLVDWRTHLDTLKEWREKGLVRYIGVTTSHGRRHDAIERIIRERADVDFVQLTYNLADRQAEQRLLPLAADHGKAVIINRPFRRGALIQSLSGRSLPPFATEIGCESWPQYLLKFIVSHPAVSCAIPATSRTDHMIENMAACRGDLPSAAMRRRMAAHFDAL